MIEALSEHLSGRLGLAEVLAALQASRKEMTAHQKDISSIIHGIPDFLIASERDDWTAVFSGLNQRLKEAEEKFRERPVLEQLAADLPEMQQQLAINSLMVREGGWAARGPSSHSGVNELMHLLEKLLDEQTDELFALMETKLEVELTRFEIQAERYQELPPFIAEAMEELLPEYKELLETVARIEELEDEELEELFSQLEEWGANFSAYDLDFIVKRYSPMPTALPAVNLALNCQLLLLEEFVAPEMVDYAVEQALDVLENGSQQFLAEQTLSAVDAHAFGEYLSGLLTGLEELPDIEDKDELKEAGGKLIELVGRFVETQSRAEEEGGSRLDFKTE